MKIDLRVTGDSPGVSPCLWQSRGVGSIAAILVRGLPARKAVEGLFQPVRTPVIPGRIAGFGGIRHALLANLVQLVAIVWTLIAASMP